jgi:chromosome segregation protein
VRLTQIKLSGFKSFVDPTSINVPGQLVGVVGPNGCGKSNVIDAVRWVLGESKASALRGESMQDVIFNGSGQRKPVARASVELHFDNSMGKAGGQWSQYAEIAVKRVLQRDGESSYFINNVHVRRRDIQDIFMGTGLGPRAYAIIEQGMISRIIEAKPEELRVFLEEAAGVSKYKDRRRETENRLADTRENLSRVADIQQELGVQVEKLEKQAEVAKTYQDLQDKLKNRQNLLWLVRKKEAEADFQRYARDVEKTTNDLEEETARLREVENRLETIRAEHYSAGDVLSAAQAELFSANTEVARLEADIRHMSDTRQRLESRLADLKIRQEQWRHQSGELESAKLMWRQRHEEAVEKVAGTQDIAITEAGKLPGAEQVFRAEREKVTEARATMARTTQAFQIEQTHISHAGKTLQGLEQREERLNAEKAAMALPDPAILEKLQMELAEVEAQVSDLEALLLQRQADLPGLTQTRQETQAQLQRLQQEAGALEGRLAALRQIQKGVDENSKIHDWLETQGLSSLPRLWQKITVEPGWENAVESVLREKLHAIELADPDQIQRLLDNPPPAKLSVFASGGAAGNPAAGEFPPLATYVRFTDSGIAALIEGWLDGYLAVEGIPRLMTRLALPVGTVLVNRDGHQFGRQGLTFHAPDPADTGILARQREIEALALDCEQRQGELAATRDALAEAEERVSACQAAQAEVSQQLAAARQRAHALQLEQVRVAQSAERVSERGRQISLELQEIAQHKQTELEHQAQAEARLEQLQGEIDALHELLESAQNAFQAAEAALESQRMAIQQAEREHQQAMFNERECTSKIGEIEALSRNLVEQIAAGLEQAGQFQGEIDTLSDTAQREQLQGALELKLAKEQALSRARDHQETVSAGLRSAESQRTESEQKLDPLRERIGELKLKEQAGRLSYEQFANQLFEAGADEAALEASIEPGQKGAPLQGEITRLTNAIAELGAVNMAALDELTQNRERKSFLDSQSADLAEALATLENAIRKIDRETRDLLQQTFDTVNSHFGTMFPTLFGGGEAKLIMTGEEILDAGIQVMAHPPGKKNASIHLLSGGEKALTAIALVFSMFQLNPAPFCLLDEVDAPLDDSNTERFCELVRKMSSGTQFVFISHNKITMELASQLVGVTMQESGVSRVVAVDMEQALRLAEDRQEPVAA